MISRYHNKLSIRRRLAVLGAAVACIGSVCAPPALALNPQPLPPGIPTHITPPDPCSTARC
jgi:hypothetical protein